MLKPICLCLVLFFAGPAWCQTDVSTTQPGTDADQSGMLTPAPVSDRTYPTQYSAERRSNYLRAGLIFSPAYSDNVLGENINGKPISDVSYSIYPTIEIDKVDDRMRWSSAYSPGFTAYQHTSDRSQEDQNASLTFEYRLTPHVTANLQDAFLQSSGVFNQPYPFSAGAISGATQSPTIAVIPPTANLLTNVANMGVQYQFGPNGMIGGSASFSNLHYPDPNQVPGLYDSASREGTGFYSHRLSQMNYVGAVYQYSSMLSYPVNTTSDVQTQNILLFYTLFITPTVSFSFSGGPQYYGISQAPLQPYSSWDPLFKVSTGWQRPHTAFSASYTRSITAGGGLVGDFHSNIASAYLRQRLSRTWRVAASGSYAISTNVTPAGYLSSPGGHSILGAVSLIRPLDPHFTVEFGYTYLHQSYTGIPVITISPNTNREYINITYQFSRPLGGG